LALPRPYMPANSRVIAKFFNAVKRSAKILLSTAAPPPSQPQRGARPKYIVNAVRNYFTYVVTRGVQTGGLGIVCVASACSFQYTFGYWHRGCLAIFLADARFVLTSSMSTSSSEKRKVISVEIEIPPQAPRISIRNVPMVLGALLMRISLIEIRLAFSIAAKLCLGSRTLEKNRSKTSD